MSPGNATFSQLEDAIQTQSGRKTVANNLVKAMDRLAMAHPGFGVNVDDGQRIVEGKIPKPDPNHVDVDTEVSNITTMQPKHSSAFRGQGVVRPWALRQEAMMPLHKL